MIDRLSAQIAGPCFHSFLSPPSLSNSIRALLLLNAARLDPGKLPLHMSCQCLFLPRQEIRECVCSRRTQQQQQQHSHGNASLSPSIRRRCGAMRLYSSLLRCLGPRLQAAQPVLASFSAYSFLRSPLQVNHLVLFTNEGKLSCLPGACVPRGSAIEIKHNSVFLSPACVQTLLQEHCGKLLAKTESYRRPTLARGPHLRQRGCRQ